MVDNDTVCRLYKATYSWGAAQCTFSFGGGSPQTQNWISFLNSYKMEECDVGMS